MLTLVMHKLILIVILTDSILIIEVLYFKRYIITSYFLVAMIFQRYHIIQRYSIVIIAHRFIYSWRIHNLKYCSKIYRGRDTKIERNSDNLRILISYEILMLLFTITKSMLRTVILFVEYYSLIVYGAIFSVHNLID